MRHSSIEACKSLRWPKSYLLLWESERSVQNLSQLLRTGPAAKVQHTLLHQVIGNAGITHLLAPHFLNIK